MPTARVGKIDLYYETLGKGTPLLMIMGLKFSLLNWGKKLPQKLAENILQNITAPTLILAGDHDRAILLKIASF